MSLLTIANLLLIFAFISYFIHAYSHNTVDFIHYRHLMDVPVKNWPLKYVYINSFFLFMVSAGVFVASVALGGLQIESLAGRRAIFALAVILAIGALRLITKPNMAKWPRRAR